MSWKKLDYLLEERKKVVPFIAKNLSLISQQKPQSGDILSPEHQHVQHHDEDYSPPTIINNIPVNFDHADEPTIPNENVQQDDINEQVENDLEQTNNENINQQDVELENDNQNSQDNQEDLTNNNNLLFI